MYALRRCHMLRPYLDVRSKMLRLKSYYHSRWPEKPLHVHWALFFPSYLPEIKRAKVIKCALRSKQRENILIFWAPSHSFDQSLLTHSTGCLPETRLLPLKQCLSLDDFSSFSANKLALFVKRVFMCFNYWKLWEKQINSWPRANVALPCP